MEHAPELVHLVCRCISKEPQPPNNECGFNQASVCKLRILQLFFTRQFNGTSEGPYKTFNKIFVFFEDHNHSKVQLFCEILLDLSDSIDR